MPSTARRGMPSSEPGILPKTPITDGCWQVTGGLMRFESSGELTEKSILGTARPVLPAPGQRDPFPAPRQDLGSTGAWRRCRALGAGQAGTARRGRGGCLPGADVTDGEVAACLLQAGTQQRDACGDPRGSILRSVPLPSPKGAPLFPGAHSKPANRTPAGHLHPTAVRTRRLGFPSGMSPSTGDATHCWPYPAKPRHQHGSDVPAAPHGRNPKLTAPQYLNCTNTLLTDTGSCLRPSAWLQGWGTRVPLSPRHSDSWRDPTAHLFFPCRETHSTDIITFPTALHQALGSWHWAQRVSWAHRAQCHHHHPGRGYCAPLCAQVHKPRINAKRHRGVGTHLIHSTGHPGVLLCHCGITPGLHQREPRECGQGAGRKSSEVEDESILAGQPGAGREKATHRAIPCSHQALFLAALHTLGSWRRRKEGELRLGSTAANLWCAAQVQGDAAELRASSCPNERSCP